MQNAQRDLLRISAPTAQKAFFSPMRMAEPISVALVLICIILLRVSVCVSTHDTGSPRMKGGLCPIFPLPRLGVVSASRLCKYDIIAGPQYNENARLPLTLMRSFGIGAYSSGSIK